MRTASPEGAPAPAGRRRAAAVAVRVDADHARVAELLARRETFLKLVAEDEAELRARGIELEAIRPAVAVGPRLDHCVSIAEAAQALKVSKRTVQRWAAASGCGWLSVTGRWRVDLPALKQWLAELG